MFDGLGLVVSLPINELAERPPPGSVFELEQIEQDGFSSDLKVAIELVVRACRDRGLRLQFVARPEVFTNSASLAWLRKRLGEIEDHLCITDGLTVRVLPGMRNHMFLYRPGVQANQEAFNRLMRRAPELVSTMCGQVNSTFSVKLAETRIVPPAIVLPGEGTPAAAVFYHFLIDKRSAEKSARLVAASQAAEPDRDRNAAEVVYIPLTEVAARDRVFAEVVSGFVLRAYKDQRFVLILRLPFVGAPAAGLEARIGVGLAGLCASRAGLPSVRADNILFASDDVGAGFFEGRVVHLVAHQTFEFWRYSPAVYRGCSTVTVYGDPRRRADRAGIRRVLGGLMGREPVLTWLPVDVMREG